MKKPNFFIVGGPKCGTTSLANYLREHPRIFFPAAKEPHFFNTDMTFRNVRSEAQYEACFRDAGQQHAAIGEGSVFYLYSDVAIPNIIAEIPDARFIAMVRNPLEMASSLHTQLRYNGDENVADFGAAWRLQPERAAGNALPRFCRDASILLYGKVCSLGG